VREIKFRAWDKKAKDWLLVYQLGNSGKYFDILNPTKQVGKEIELMQYTGLKDRHGKEIYEGDIVSQENYPTLYYQVKFDIGDFRVGFIKTSNKENWTDIGKEIVKRFEVIGNIYENSELTDSKEVK